MTERENMPIISTAARKEFDKYPNSQKSFNGQSTKQQAVLATCIVCEKQYNNAEAVTLLADLPAISNFPYENTCLSCIKEGSELINEANHQALLDAKKSLDELAIAYQKAHNKHKALSNSYKELNYQSSRINYHLTKPVIEPKNTAKKPKNKVAQTPQAMAMKILASLSPEQRASIVKNMK